MIPNSTSRRESTLAASFNSRLIQFPFGSSPSFFASVVISAGQFVWVCVSRTTPTAARTTVLNARSAAIHGSSLSLRSGPSSLIAHHPLRRPDGRQTRAAGEASLRRPERGRISMHGKDDHRSCSRCRSRRRRPGGKATRAARGGVWAAIVLVLGATGGTVPGAAGATAGTAPSARAPAPATAIASIARAQTVRLGSQTLERCQEKPLASCGKLAVPLDYSSPSGPFISVAYR